MWRLHAIFFFPLIACSGDLPPEDIVDKLRLLAVRADPPEVMPSQPSHLDTLTVFPPDTNPTISYLWLACQDQPGTASPTACDVTSMIGANSSETYSPPPGALGTDVIITVIVADESAGGATNCAIGASENGGAPTNPDHCIIALKRLTVSQSPTPNHNPTLESFTLASAPLPDGARFPVGGGASQLATARSPDSAEPKQDGTYEQLYISWYATSGVLQDSRTSFYPSDCDPSCMKPPPPLTASTQWTPPNSASEVTFWAVIRDDRGGIAWLSGQATP